MKTIGLIGAGHIGSQIARLAVAAAMTSSSATRAGRDARRLVAELGPKARAATACEAAEAGDIVVVTIPLKNYRSVPVEPLAGKIVIDTNNYYPQRDGHIPELDNESTTTAELLQAHLPKSKVVKAFNHIYAAQFTTDGPPAGTKNRRALVIAGDDPAAKATVTRLLDQFGFDTVDAGPLSELAYPARHARLRAAPHCGRITQGSRCGHALRRASLIVSAGRERECARTGHRWTSAGPRAPMARTVSE